MSTLDRLRRRYERHHASRCKLDRKMLPRARTPQTIFRFRKLIMWARHHEAMERLASKIFALEASV